MGAGKKTEWKKAEGKKTEWKKGRMIKRPNKKGRMIKLRGILCSQSDVAIHTY